MVLIHINYTFLLAIVIANQVFAYSLTLKSNLVNIKRSHIRLYSMFSNIFKQNSINTWDSSNFVDTAISIENLDQLLKSIETSAERSNYELQLQGYGTSNSKALIRLFDKPANFKPTVILYRDSASWCPYCEKVWLQLEEKRIPYVINKINMRCYGEKPIEFMRLNPSGTLPVAIINDEVIAESNVIMNKLEELYPNNNPLLPSRENSARYNRVQGLYSLERKLFSTWFTWLTSRAGATSAGSMDYYLSLIEEELAKDSSGPYFLGEFSLVDIMFTPFLERMAASLPYYKGYEIRTKKFPNLLAWYEAMDSREAYQGIKSDYYTHCHDLPPQIGSCQFLDGSEPYTQEIDGGAWSINKKAEDCYEPMIPKDEGIAKRDAVRQIIRNFNNVIKFCLRGVGIVGSPRVSAPLADPNAVPNLSYEPAVDSAMRHILHALLIGHEDNNLKLSIAKQKSTLPIDSVISSLLYIRDRVGVPRDMSVHGAKQLRSHINWYIDQIK